MGASTFSAMTPWTRRLVAVASVCIVLGFLDVCLRELRTVVGAARMGSMQMSAYTDADEAHVAFTNLTSVTRYACVRGTVTPHAKGALAIETATICTGDVAPHASLTVSPRYPVNKVRDACSVEGGSLGIRQLDWSLCDFNVDDVTAEAQ